MMSKKLCILLLIFSISLSLGACNVNENQQETDTASCVESTASSEIFEGIIIDYPLPTFEDLDGWEQHQEENHVPENFVTYDMISVFGGFDGLVLLENALKPPYQYKEYMYGFLNGEQSFSMYVYHDYEKEKDSHYVELPTISEMPSEDMRYAPEGVTRGSYYVNDMEFCYLHGGLYTIQWYGINNVYFSFVFDDFGRDEAYDIDNDLIKGFLNRNTIEASKSALDNFMNEKK